MAVNYLIFGNADSRDFDIEVFYNDIDRTPKRVYERVEVPNRNGAILIDAKRYEDVPVSYDCIALDDDDRKEFLNALASQIGYKRMEDSFNGDEFYSAVFEGDVDPNVTVERDKSTFTIYFTRKPQRWLRVGDTASSVASGDIVSNPTLFASSPMLEVEGYGSIDWGDGEIKVENGPIGDIVVHESSGGAGSSSLSWTIDDHLANVGDALTVSSSLCQMRINYVRSADSYDYTTTGNPVVSVRYTKTTAILGVFHIDISPAPFTFAYGTASSKTATVSGTAVHNGSTDTFDITITCAYDGSTGFTLTLSVSVSTYMDYNDNYIDQFQTGRTVLNSSQSALGNPLYIDLELGYAYKYENDNPVSVNNGIILPATLPTLAPGANTITFDNTITDLQVVPRWWKI